MQFNPLGGHYWEKPVFQRQDLRDAYDLLEKHTASQKRLNQAFLVLLGSNDAVAQGITFDLYFSCQRQGRWGVENPYEAFSTLLAEAARHQLRQPPLQSGHVMGANHASALGVLAHLGGAADLALIEPILHTSADLNVIEMALIALGWSCLPDCEAFPQTLVETMSQLMTDEALDLHTREDAIGAWRNARSLPPEIENLCLHIAQHTSPQLSRLPMQAAWT